MTTPPTQTAPRRRGPVPKLSAAKIADAVLAVGFDQASVTAVAERLEVTHAALYRYIGDRDGMLRAGIDRLTDTWEWPELAEDWQQVLWDEARSWWALCQANPGFVSALVTTAYLPVPVSRRFFTVAAHLETFGVSPADTVMVVDLVIDMVHDIFHRARQREGVIDKALHMSPETAAMHLGGVPLELVEVVLQRVAGDDWSWFVRKLELVIDGLAARIAAN